MEGAQVTGNSWGQGVSQVRAGSVEPSPGRGLDMRGRVSFCAEVLKEGLVFSRFFI